MQFFFLVFLSFWTARTYPKLKQQQKIRFRRRLALFEQKKMAPVLGKKAVRFLRKSATDFGENPSPILGKSVTDFGEIRHRLWGNPSTILGKSVTDFGENPPPILGKIRHRFWGNPSPILGKSVTDFGKIRHRLWGNPSSILPTLGKSVADLRKSATDFGEISHYRFWVNPAPIPSPTLGILAASFVKLGFHRRFLVRNNICRVFGKNMLRFEENMLRFWENMLRFWEKHAPFLGRTGSVFGKTCSFSGKKTCSVFGKNRLRFWDKLAPFLGKTAQFGGNWFGFWIGLRQSSSLTVLNTKHVWVWVSLKISQLVGSWKVYKPTNFDVEPVLC